MIVYRASHADLNDGHGDVVVGYFQRREDAEKASANFFIMGSPTAPCGKVTEIRVFGSFDEFQRREKAGARLRAWEKLSAEEREAVGLTARPHGEYL